MFSRLAVKFCGYELLLLPQTPEQLGLHTKEVRRGLALLEQNDIGCEPLCGCWVPNLGPLWEQPER